jgi:hypothetical protein
MPDPDLIAAIFVPTSLAAIVYAVAHYFYKWRALAKMTPAADVEKRLARVEVALDDVAAELMRVTEGQQMLTKLLAERASEASHAPR